ncbi:OmpA family protein [Edaphobacter sp.]|uniref:OmpA family protein n=1 Tax=Edaphobacter sp. TaxID=1934404 RepID=UPI002DBBC5AB|nr:OmpA family protein [Edaphobacter sp.]HEU5340314.1 OmpA family protein [Edaphobacter sp.]
MNRKGKFFAVLALVVFCGYSTVAIRGQEPNPTSQPEPGPQQQPQELKKGDNGIYIYRVKVVQRDLDAVNYLHRSGTTTVGFKGTMLLPLAKGEARVTSERGGIHIEAKFQGLTPANGFGAEYLTYVLWAITPDGRPNNLGEILPSSGGKSNIDVTTALQSFGLVVTAEPYFSVTQPSDVVVLQNVILNDKTSGVLEKVNAHYSLLPRGTYAGTGSDTVANPITRNEKAPLELYQAYNAVRIATDAGAEKYATDIMAEAKQDLRNAADIAGNKKGNPKMAVTFARQAVQRAEDARIVTLRKQADERQMNAELAKRDAQAKAQQSALEAQQAQLAAEQAKAAQAQADAERARAEAQAAADRAAAAEAQAKADAAKKSADDANAVREKLRSQLNSVLATSETARGLIVNMSDVLFDTGKYTLKPNTQLSLAKVAGILAAYPGLKLQVEGYTDSVGSDDYNQKLSENRADAVRNFLITQGVGQDSISSTGYGKANPVADNSTSAGRAKNRRVQLVVSGNAIGVAQSAPTAAAQPAPQ